jgi:hypothetical protein
MVAEPIVVKRSEARQGDILCCRGNGVLTHPGNIFYLELIKKYQKIYQRTSPKSLNPREKRTIVRKVVDTIEELDPPGRFLRMAGRQEGGVEIFHVIQERETIIKKVSQALREKPKKSVPKGGMAGSSATTATSSSTTTATASREAQKNQLAKELLSLSSSANINSRNSKDPEMLMNHDRNRIGINNISTIRKNGNSNIPRDAESLRSSFSSMTTNSANSLGTSASTGVGLSTSTNDQECIQTLLSLNTIMIDECKYSEEAGQVNNALTSTSTNSISGTGKRNRIGNLSVNVKENPKKIQEGTGTGFSRQKRTCFLQNRKASIPSISSSDIYSYQQRNGKVNQNLYQLTQAILDDRNNINNNINNHNNNNHQVVSSNMEISGRTVFKVPAQQQQQQQQKQTIKLIQLQQKENGDTSRTTSETSTSSSTSTISTMQEIEANKNMCTTKNSFEEKKDNDTKLLMIMGNKNHNNNKPSLPVPHQHQHQHTHQNLPPQESKSYRETSCMNEKSWRKRDFSQYSDYFTHEERDNSSARGGIDKGAADLLLNFGNQSTSFKCARQRNSSQGQTL